MDYSTVFGTLGGLLLIFISISSGNKAELGIFLNIQAFLLVIGGTIAATTIAFPSRELFTIISVIGRVFDNPKTEVNSIIRFITTCLEKQRSGGHLALEQMVNQAQWISLRKGLQLISDGADNDTLIEILSIEQRAIEEYHRVGQRIFSEMAKYAPAFGMLGTLVGLVKMLSGLENPETIGPKMAIALMTTLYGVLLSNLIFLPMVTKLERRSRIEALQIRLMIVGLVSINKSDSMIIAREKMGAFLANEASGTALDRRRRNRRINKKEDHRRKRRW